TADFQIGRLKADWLRAAAVAGTLSSTESGLRLSSFSMALHGGTLTGRSDYDRHTHAFTLAARARAIDSGSLLEALARTRRFEGAVEGRAELSGSLQNGDIAESLRGEVSLSIADGRLHGIDLARVVRDQARALRALRDRDSRRRSPEDTEALHGPASDVTEFTRLGASFLIGEGQARSRNLLIETPLLKVNGSGVIDLGELAIDASLRVGLKAPGNDPLLTALSRLSLPIQVQGPLKHPNWQVDAAALLPQRPRR
ncbi:MAG: AsmA-like C-terminal region-containing protein, partial [Betaproteobacteria bacterium]